MMLHAKRGHALKDAVCVKQPWKARNLIWATFPSPSSEIHWRLSILWQTGFEVCVIKYFGIIFTSKNTLRALSLFSQTGSFPLASASRIHFLHFKHDYVWFALLPCPLREVHEGVWNERKLIVEFLYLSVLWSVMSDSETPMDCSPPSSSCP